MKYVIIEFKSKKSANEFIEVLESKKIQYTKEVSKHFANHITVKFELNGYISACNDLLKSTLRQEVIKIIFLKNDSYEFESTTLIHRKDIAELWL